MSSTGAPTRRARTTATWRRMALLLAGLPQEVPGTTVNRLCGSSLDAIGIAARAIKSGETALMIAGGVESMSRAPFVMAKADAAFSRSREDRRHDHRLALRQPADEGALRRRLDAGDRRERGAGFQRRARRPGSRLLCAASSGRQARSPPAGFAEEIVPVTIPSKKGDPIVVEQDEHPRDDDARSAGQAEGRRAPGWNGDGGQCLGRERRRVRAAARLRGRGEALRPDAAGARGRRGDRRRRAAHHGLRPRARDAQSAGARPV